jgi:hypothetical protein
VTSAQVLSEAKAIVRRGHYAPPEGIVRLAVDARYERVKPTAPSAVAWMSVGAVCKVAPARSLHDTAVYADNTEAGWQAYLLLQEAAEAQGYADTAQVDRAGLAAALGMFDKAIMLAPCAPGKRRAVA